MLFVLLKMLGADGMTQECDEKIVSVNLLSLHKSFSKLVIVDRKSKSKKTPRLLVTFDTAY